MGPRLRCTPTRCRRDPGRSNDVRGACCLRPARGIERAREAPASRGSAILGRGQPMINRRCDGRGRGRARGGGRRVERRQAGGRRGCRAVRRSGRAVRRSRSGIAAMRRYIRAVAGPEERQVEVGAEVHDGGSRGPDSRTVLAWAFGIATLLGWSTVAFVYFGMNAFGRTLSFPRALIAGLPDWYLWAAATPGIFWIGQRFTLGRSRWLVLGLHLVVGSLVVLAELGMVVALNRMLGVPSFMSPWREVYLRVVLQYFHLNFMVYWVIVAAAHATRYYQSYRERAMAALALESERNRAA